MDSWKPILLLLGSILLTLPESDLIARGSYFPEDFMTVPQIQPARFSPGGEALLNIVYNRGSYRLYIYDLEKERNSRLWQLKDNETVTEIGWAGNNRIVFQINHGPIWRIDRDGNNPVQIYDADLFAVGYLGIYSGNLETTQILHFPSHEEGDLIVSEFHPNTGTRIFEINLATGKEKEISKHDDLFNFATDHVGTIRIAHTVTGSGKFRILHRRADNQSWKNLDDLLPASPNRFQYDPFSIAGRNHVLLGFGMDPELAYLASNAASDRMALFEFNLNTGKLALIHEDPVYDVFSMDPFISKIRLIFSEKEQTLAGYQYIAEKVERHWLLPAYEAVENKLDERFPGKLNIILGTDPNDRYFCVLSYSSRHPGTLYVYDAQLDRLLSLGELASWIDEEDMAPMEPVSFQARDGHLMHGYLTMPVSDSGNESKAVPPMIVMVHGGPWVRDVYGFLADVQWLAYNGYSVLQINYRGSSGYGFKHLDMARQRYGTASLEDIIDGVNWAVSEGYADPELVGIMGGSYGGYSAALALALHPGKFRCGVAINGNFDLVEMTRIISRESPVTYRYWKEFVGSVFRKDALRKASPIEHVSGIEDPLFVIAGEKDETVPVQQSREFVAALEKQHIPHEYREYRGEDHAISGRSNHVHMLENIVNFLQKHLPVDP